MHKQDEDVRIYSRTGNDVTIVDLDPHLVRDITDQLDVQGIAAFRKDPDWKRFEHNERT